MYLVQAVSTAEVVWTQGWCDLVWSLRLATHIYLCEVNAIIGLMYSRQPVLRPAWQLDLDEVSVELQIFHALEGSARPVWKTGTGWVEEIKNRSKSFNQKFYQVKKRRKNPGMGKQNCQTGRPPWEITANFKIEVPNSYINIWQKLI